MYDKTRSLAFFLLILIGFTNNIAAQIAQRGTATTASVSNSNTLTINKPTGVVAGDIMIATFASSDNSSLSGNNADLTGWTDIDGNNLNNNRKRVSAIYKIATGTEPASYTFNVSNGTGTTDRDRKSVV